MTLQYRPVPAERSAPPAAGAPTTAAIAKHTIVEFSIVIAVVLIVQAMTLLTQERISINEGKGYDGADYFSVAEQLADGERPTGTSRFVKRFGTPFLVALLDSGDPIRGFAVVNAIPTLASAVLLLVWLRMHVRTWWLRVALMLVYATHWLQLIRFTMFYPVLVDPWAQMFCFAGLNCIAAYESGRARWAVFGVSIVGAIGVFFREIVFLIPVAFLFARNPVFQHRREFPYVRMTNLPLLAQWIPVVLSFAALLWIGNFIVADDPAFSMRERFENRAVSRSLIGYALGWMIAYGPALFVVLFDWRSTAQFFARHKALLAYTGAVAVLAWFASDESERHALYWASPIMYALVGRTIERHRGLFRSSALIAFLIAAQIVISRVFMATPQADGSIPRSVPPLFLTPFGDTTTYLHLFPSYVSSRQVVILCAQHLALGAVILLWMSRRAYLQSHSDSAAKKPDAAVATRV